MNYDLRAVRLACLELMGWMHVGDYRWTSPDGYTHYDMDGGRATAVPDPTTSLDDAQPLMERFELMLLWPALRDGQSGWMAVYDREADEDCGMHAVLIEEAHDSAPLAVCLAALRCAERDLKDFEIPPTKDV